MLFISVDGGTTNTRLVLMKDGKVKSEKRLSVGMRDNVIGSGSSYEENLAFGIRELLAENALTEKDVEAVTVSGMICSERGLYEVPHIAAPVNVKILSEAMKCMRFPTIADLPFWMIPGVKSFADTSGDLSAMDIMRGEETELFGMMEQLSITGNATFVLPGSHCKIIPVEEDGTLCAFATTVSGELIRAAAEHTILADGIRGAFPRELSQRHLLLGFDYAKEHGMTEALFKVRILQKFKGLSPEELYAVLCGAILSEDIRVIQNRSIGLVLVGGSEPFRSAYTALIRERTDLNAQSVSDEISRFAVAFGAERLLKEKKG